MSIFDEKRFCNNSIDKEIVEIYKRINWDEYVIAHGSTYYWKTLNFVLDNYARNIMTVIDGEYFFNSCENKIEQVELLFNIITYLFYLVNIKDSYKLNNYEKWAGIYHHIIKLLENKDYKLVEIEEHKYKIVKSAEGELIENISNSDWRKQMGIFFSSNDLIEKEKILEWFKGHLEKNKRYYLENENEILDKKTSKENFRKLNNWFGHKNYDSKSNENKHHYNEYHNKTNNEKNKILNDIGHWILYSLTEIERNSKS